MRPRKVPNQSMFAAKLPVPVAVRVHVVLSPKQVAAVVPGVNVTGPVELMLSFSPDHWKSVSKPYTQYEDCQL